MGQKVGHIGHPKRNLKIIYTGSNNNQNAKHVKAIALGNLMDLHQERNQDIREFRDQYQAIRKVCTELAIRIRRCNDNAKAILDNEGIAKPTKEQLKDALDRAADENTRSYFYTKPTKKYGKFIENAQNDVLQKKDDLFPKSIADMCRVLTGWKNHYGGKYNRFSEANDSIALRQHQWSSHKRAKARKRSCSVTSANKRVTTQINALTTKKKSQGRYRGTKKRLILS